MKITSQQVGTGKLGNAVYSKVAGECIARQYNPNVSNPQTEAQVEKRSAFKLLSQLSACLKSDIAIKRDGLKTPRNQFMSINKNATRVNDGVASINLNAVQITKSNRGLGEFSADRSTTTMIAVALQEDANNTIDRMVYAAYIKMDDGSLVAHDSIVVSEAGDDGTFSGELRFTDKAVVIYAYGVKLDSNGAKAAFGNLTAPTAEQVAKLITTSTEMANGSSVTKTKGLTMLVGETTGDSDAEEHFSVSVSASGNGSVSGGGRFVAGQIATLTATPVPEASFVAWKKDSKNGQTLSTNATYSFEVTEDIVIVGVFQGGPVPSYSINATVDPALSGGITGTGSKQEGTTATLTFTPAAGSQLVFDGWYENNVKVSAANPYSFEVERNRNLVAKSVEAPESPFSNVQINGADWNDNKNVGATPAITLSAIAQGSATNVALQISENKPTIGAQVNTGAIKGSTAITAGTISMSPQLAQGDTGWLVECHTINTNTVEIDAVYDYHCYYPEF